MKRVGKIELWLTIALICLAILAFGFVLKAQAASTSELRFQRLSALGADQLSTLSLLQDRQGFVWIGTNNAGLYRFDGYHSEKYQSQANDPHSLPHDRISALYEDQQGRIWAGTQNGLALFNPKTNNFTRYIIEGGPSNQRIIKVIASDGKDGLWLATWGGLQHFDTNTGKFTLYAHDPNRPDSLGKNDLNAIVVDQDGGVWAGTWPAGLDYLAPGSSSFQHYRLDSENAPDSKLNIVRSLFIDDHKRLWIGTENGVVLWDTKQEWSTRKRLDTPSSRVNYLYRDRNGVMWAATLSAGLLRWNAEQERFTQFVKQAIDPYSLPSDDVRAVLHDRGGMLWVATLTDGIALANLNSRGFRRIIPFDADADNPRPNNSLLRIVGKGDGKLWLSSNSGVALFDPVSGDVLKRYQADKKRKGALSNDLAYSLYQEKDGPLWVGTSVGLNRLDPGKDEFKLFRFGSIADDYINVIAPAAEGKLWLGTGDSLIHFDPHTDRYTKYTPDPKNPTSRSAKGTTVILHDKQGRVWAGAEWVGGGLDLLDLATGQFRHFKHHAQDATSISADNVSSLYQDNKGRIWVGTINGLNLLVEEKGEYSFRHFDGPNSVGRAKIVAIEGDHKGRLWLSTVDGLISFDPDHGDVYRYNVSDGLSDNFAGPSHRSADGLLYFGGTKGMTVVNPDKVQRITVPPQVAITDISVFNRSLKSGKGSDGVALQGSVTAPMGLSIARQESVFSIEFAALHFTNPSANRYAYRLAGFDRDWVEVDADHRNATYTNLNPGDYTFQVKATNDLGVWSDSITSVNIAIPPKYYQTTWFRWLVAVLSAGLLWLAYLWRVGHLKRDQARLEALVAVRLQELLAQQQVNRDNAERMQAVLQNAADAILTADKHWTIESCNQAGLEIFAASAEAIHGRSFLQFCVEDLSERLQQGIQAPDFIEKGHAELEVQLKRADGTPFIAELSLSGFADAGQRKFILIVRDVTEQRRVEKLKTQFVSTVSHELRTPLTAIRGGLGLMVGGATGELPPAAAKLGQIALGNAERLARLINDLLDMQKIEANMMDFNFQQLALEKLLADVIESNQAFAQKLGVQLELQNTFSNANLRVDADRFAQVMANLMSNACKYSPKGGIVTLRTVPQGEHRVRLEVVDRGPGIPAQFAERIFQKFSQADASDTRAKDGTGLGLAIAKEMVEKMDGAIGFMPNPEGGTIFFVEFEWR